MEKLSTEESKPFFKALLLQYLADGKKTLLNSYPCNKQLILECWQEIIDGRSGK